MAFSTAAVPTVARFYAGCSAWQYKSTNDRQQHRNFWQHNFTENNKCSTKWSESNSSISRRRQTTNV